MLISPNYVTSDIRSTAKPAYSRIICLSNVFDQNYHDLRGEKIGRCLGAKRPVLFQCLQEASGREVVVLSSPAPASERRAPKWLPAVETRYAAQRQFFCAGWDAPKVRVLLSWFFYARHVLRHVRSGDLVVIDNYEFIYVFAAWFLKLFRRVTFILDYEDGKHLTERFFCWKVLSGLAEAAGRPLLSGALLAHPALGKRLPAALPTELVPGFVPEQIPDGLRPPGAEVRFLYSGTLDSPRGVDLMLEALQFLPGKGWHLDITGHGPLMEQISRFSSEARWKGKVEYHQALPPADYERLKAACHAGLNCQRTSDPISGVTFPSKVFTYLSAGLVVISSKASEVETICGKACLYYDSETPQSLAAAMKEAITNFPAVCRKLDRTAVTGHYSAPATTARLQKFLQAVGLPE
jgi:glycosyltransferase involved in cell wall biosynthesis